MEWWLECGLLVFRSRAALFAADFEPSVRISVGERGSAAAYRAFAAFVDKIGHPDAKFVPRIQPRFDRLPQPLKSPRPRLRSAARRGKGVGGQQFVELGPGRRAKLAKLQG